MANQREVMQTVTEAVMELVGMGANKHFIAHALLTACCFVLRQTNPGEHIERAKADFLDTSGLRKSMPKQHTYH